MIAGLPFGTWVLTALAVVPGIVLVAVAYRVHRRGDARGPGPQPDGDDARGTPRSDGGDAMPTGPQPGRGAPPQATQRGEGGRG